MKSYEKKFYGVLKTFLFECIDEMGLPKKPTVKTLYKIKKIINKYEKEIRKYTPQIPQTIPYRIISEEHID